MENGFNVGQGIRSFIFIIIGLIFITPLLWMVSTSFKFESQVFEKPFVFFHWGQLNFENYRNIWLNTPFLTWLYNSIFVVVFSVVFRLIIAAFGGYSFGFLKFKYSGSIFFLFLMTLFVPYQLTLLPQFIAFRFVHLLDTRWGINHPKYFGYFIHFHDETIFFKFSS